MAVLPAATLSAVPPFPALSDRSLGTYNSKAYTFGVYLGGTDGVTPGTFVTQINAVTDNVNHNATEAETAATAAAASAATAQGVQDVVLGAAHFVGLWPELSGTLNKPASVKHNGRFWLLLNDLVSVAASEPGVSADWTSIDVGDVVQEVGSNTAMVPGVRYIVTAAGITLTAPATLLTGDRIDVMNASSGDINVDFNGHTVKSQTPDSPIVVPTLRGLSVTYTGSTLG